MIKLAKLFVRWWILETRHEIARALSDLLPPCACPGCDDCHDDGRGNCRRRCDDGSYCSACVPTREAP